MRATPASMDRTSAPVRPSRHGSTHRTATQVWSATDAPTAAAIRTILVLSATNRGPDVTASSTTSRR
jgi:hypothetical protein